MKLGGTNLGGLSGGLYSGLAAAGRLLFTVLLGSDRAARVGLEYAAVYAGGVHVGMFVGLITALPMILGVDSHWPLVFLIGTGGGVVGWLLAAMLIAFVRRLRREEHTLRPLKIANKTFDQIVAEKQSEFQTRGYSHEEAAREAYWFAEYSQRMCFVATTVFQSASCPEIAVFRNWRDKRLRVSVIGRALVETYETVGPFAAQVVERLPVLRPQLRRCLSWLSSRLER